MGRRAVTKVRSSFLTMAFSWHYHSSIKDGSYSRTIPATVQWSETSSMPVIRKSGDGDKESAPW